MRFSSLQVLLKGEERDLTLFFLFDSSVRSYIAKCQKVVKRIALRFSNFKVHCDGFNAKCDVISHFQLLRQCKRKLDTPFHLD